MKKETIAYAIAPALAVGLLTAGFASAHGWFGGFGFTATPEEIASRQTQMFQQQADVIGATADEVKSAWASGTSFRQLAQEKGVTDEQLREKMKTQRLAQMKTHLQTLVEQGVITQAQADQRYNWLNTQTENGHMGRGMGKRFGHGMGPGF